MDLNHLHLAVENVKKSQDFYETCFGFREKVRHGQILFLTNGDGFELALDPKYKPSKLPEWYHHGFRLADANAVRTVYAVLQTTYPSQIKRELTTIDNHTFFRCDDADGYSIEVYWEPEI